MEVDHQVVRQAQHEVSERKQEVAPDLDSQCDGEGSNGKIIIDELFRLLDKKNDGHLDKDAHPLNLLGRNLTHSGFKFRNV